VRSQEGFEVAEEQCAANVNPNLRYVIDTAKNQLRRLTEERTELNRRIAVTKQTLAGLVRVFGDAALEQELSNFINSPGTGKRQSGLTKALRMILVKGQSPISTRDICEHLTDKYAELAVRHKNLYASVTTILARLVSYGEAISVDVDGKRAWQWAGKDHATSSANAEDSQ
jgi:Ni,Fe-hydrogenase III large subunit